MLGILVKKKIESWWGRAWLEASRRLAPSRFASYGWQGLRFDEPAGYTDARRGRVLEPTLVGSQLSARVYDRMLGRHESPWIRVAPFSAETWRKITRGLASRALFEASLAAGQMPTQINEPFRAAGVHLVPASAVELSSACSCRRPEQPCDHVSALHYVFADSLDLDPLLLFELRGRPREQLFAEIRQARRMELQTTEAPSMDKNTSPGPEAPLAPEAPSSPEAPSAWFDAWSAPPPAGRAGPRPPEVPGAQLRALRAPVGWPEEDAPGDLLRPLVEAASSEAQALFRPVRARKGASRRRSAVEAAGLERVEELAARVPSVRPALGPLRCAALAWQAARGEVGPGAAVRRMQGLLSPGAPTWRAWSERRGQALAAGAGDIVVCLDIVPAAGKLETALLRSPGPGASPLLWQTTTARLPASERIKERRGLLRRLHELLPDDRNIVLLADLTAGGPGFVSFLEILGWSYVLRLDPRTVVASPDSAPQPFEALLSASEPEARRWQVRISAQDEEVPLLLVARKGDAVVGLVTDQYKLEASALEQLDARRPPMAPVAGGNDAPSMSAEQMDRWWWLQALGGLAAEELEAVIDGQSASLTQSDERRSGGLVRLIESDDEQALRWLSGVARHVAKNPSLKGVFV